MRYDFFDRFRWLYEEAGKEGAGGGGAGGDDGKGGKAGDEGAGKEGAGAGGKGKADEGQVAEPVAPDKYAIKLPEGGPFSDAHLKGFEARARAMGLTQSQAQKMVDGLVTERSSVAQTFRKSLEADKELGGDKLAETEKLAREGRDIIFHGNPERAKEFQALLDEVGYHDNPLLVWIFRQVGLMAKEDGHVGGKGGDGGEKDPMQQAKDAMYPGKYPKANA